MELHYRARLLLMMVLQTSVGFCYFSHSVSEFSVVKEICRVAKCYRRHRVAKLVHNMV